MIGKLFRSEQGYVLILTLLFMPIFIGIGLFTIDFGRAYNAQADHQAAADALALAGAYELDGSGGARERAKDAMAEIDNTVSFLGFPGSDGTIILDYEVDNNGPFTVVFLRDIPADDDDPITREDLVTLAATSDQNAKYVYVLSKARDMLAFFPDPTTMDRANVPVSASAVATSFASSCDLAPVFMCNPVSGADNGNVFRNKVVAGEFHARMLKLPTQTGSRTPNPPNTEDPPGNGNPPDNGSGPGTGTPPDKENPPKPENPPKDDKPDNENKPVKDEKTKTSTIAGQTTEVVSGGVATNADIAPTQVTEDPTNTVTAPFTPGNVGFLRTFGNGQPSLERAMAGEQYPECIRIEDTVDTQPGTISSVWDAFNTRFDIYNNNSGSWSRTGISPPAENVRKGYVPTPPTGRCAEAPIFRTTGGTSAAQQKTTWYAQNPVFSDNQDPDTSYDFTGLADGNSIRKGKWNLTEDVTLVDADGDTVTYAAYWPTLYDRPLSLAEEELITSRLGRQPSRYDVYRYELLNGLEIKKSDGGEVGNEQCYAGTPDPRISQNLDRRKMLIAVVDCSDTSRPVRGRELDLEVQAWIDIFLVNPGSKDTLDIEIIGLSDQVRTNADSFRREAILVR